MIYISYHTYYGLGVVFIFASDGNNSSIQTFQLNFELTDLLVNARKF